MSGVPAPPKVHKNAPGNRSDVAWKHGTSVDGGTKKIKCNYCGKEIGGGVYRLKHHLAGTQLNVGACNSVPDKVKEQMWEVLKSLQDNLLKKSKEDTDGEKVGEKRPIEDDENATRFATSYLTLGCLADNKRALIRMFTSDKWTSSKFAKTGEGKEIEEVVMNKDFWKDIVTCCLGAYPLIKVLRLVDSDEKPAMGFIYEAMNQAKEKIKSNFHGAERSFKPIWDIIDARWDKQLHKPLHAAGYYLNPQLHYSNDFKADFVVKRGLYECLQRMIEDAEVLTKIDAQLEDFKAKKKFFGSHIALAALKTKTPAQWWESYGDEHPELQTFAIRVLSLTCSSSGCERNWSAFEMVHTKRRNRLKQKTMNDVVFVMTNSKLAKKKQTRKEVEYSIDDINSDDEWIVNSDKTSFENEIIDFTIENENLEEDNQNEGDYGLAETVAEEEVLVHNLHDEFHGIEDEDIMEEDLRIAKEIDLDALLN